MRGEAGSELYRNAMLRELAANSHKRKAWKGMFGPEYERQDEPTLDGFG